MPRDAVSFCAECGARNLCLGVGLETEQLARLEGIWTAKQQIRAGQPLYSQGDAFSSIFAMASGTAKIINRLPGGKMIVTGIPLRGDLVGFTGMLSGTIPETLIPQEDSVFCVIPYHHLMQRMQLDPLISLQFHKAMARTLMQQQEVRLHTHEAKARLKVSGFLCWFMHQLALRNQHSMKFKLPLSRRDLANFLGLRLETVSRTFSQLSSLGIVKVRGRHIHVLDHAALQS